MGTSSADQAGPSVLSPPGTPTSPSLGRLAFGGALAYFFFHLSRYMAARTADMIFDGIDRLADSPLEVAGLSLLSAAVISWSLDRHARAAALLSALHLRLLGALLLHGAQQANGALDQLGAKAAAKGRLAEGKHRQGGEPGSPAARRRLSLGPASPGKDIASFRLPEASLAGRGAHARRQQPPAGGQQQRWSMDAGAGGAGAQHRRHMVRTQPKPRTSLDFEAVPASPPRRARHQRARAAASLAEHRAAPQLGGASDGEQGGGASRPRGQPGGGTRWQPRMQRIASGQELAVLAAGGSAGSARASLDLGPAAADPQAAAAAAGAAAPAQPPGAATLPAPSSWLPSLALTWPASPFSSATPTEAAEAGVDPSDPGAAPFSPSAAAAAVARHLAASGTAAAAWASSTVDTVLRPLIPGGTNARPLDALLWRSPSAGDALGDGSAAAGAPLQHASSAPLPRPPRRSSDHGPACSAADHRRQSLDGASARHYTHGGLTADPNRKPALEALSCAARLQSRSAHAASGSAPQPGHLALAGAGSVALQGNHAGDSCLASLGLDGDCPPEIREHVTDEHLLQFGVVAGEEAAAAAAAELALPPAWAHADCLLRAADAPSRCGEEAWELVVSRSEGGLAYEVWRQPLRGGLHMYRSRARFEGVSPRDLRPFHLDDHARNLWDENVLEIRRVKPGSQAGRLHRHSEWALHAYRSRFPRPLAAREYQYARRVWHRPSDGGCYVLCRGMPLPDAGDGTRAVKVTDFASGAVIRAAPGSGGASSELVSLYFEDSGVRPSLARMVVKGMWAYMQKYEGALRVFADARRSAAAAHASGGGAPARRSSLDGAPAAGAQPAGRRRRSLLSRLAEDDAASSSGDDALHSTYAAMARRLRRGAASRLGGGGTAVQRSRWAGRLVVLAGIKMVHHMLTSRRFG